MTTGRLFGMVTSANSSFYTHWALDSLFKNTALTNDDEIYLIDNDNVYDDEVDSRVTIIKNSIPLTFSHNANILIQLADAANKDLIFLSNDIVLTPGWLEPLEIDNAITIPSCNQTHQYKTDILTLVSNMDWADYGNKKLALYDISSMHQEQHTGYFDLLLMPFYIFRLPKDVYRKLGLLDDKFVNGGEDLDYRIRAILAGIDVKYASQSYVLHFNGKSTWRNQEQQAEIDNRNKQYRDRLTSKWGEDIMQLMVVGGNPNAVLTKYNLMSFNQHTDSHNVLIDKIYKQLERK